MTTKDRVLAALPNIEQALQTVATETLRLRGAVDTVRRRRDRPDDIGNAIDATRIANAVVGRMYGLGLGWILQLASTTEHRNSEWDAELRAALARVLSDEDVAPSD